MNYSIVTDSIEASQVNVLAQFSQQSRGQSGLGQAYTFLGRLFSPHAFAHGSWRVTLIALLGLLILCLSYSISNTNELPIVNQHFAWEPSIFARIRWAFYSQSILANAGEKYPSRPFILARGDRNFTILPERFTKELNAQPKSIIESRQAHNASLLGHLNGLDIVTRTDRHVKNLLSRVSPNLNRLQQPTGVYLDTALDEQFDLVGDKWTRVAILERLVTSVTPALTLAVFGAPLCENPRLRKLCTKYTENLFSIAFSMRLVPNCLQSSLVWLLPFKWSLRSGLKELQSIIVPEIIRRQHDASEDHSSLLSSLIHDARTPEEADPFELLQLVMIVVSGANFSVATTISHFLFDLTEHSDFRAELNLELEDKKRELDGEWDLDSLNSLRKLDSALKETTRLSPASTTTYARMMTGDYILSSGLKLSKGTFISMRHEERTLNSKVFPDPFKYDPKRAYNKELCTHAHEPFQSTDSDTFTWGSGRWACPGRFLANMVIKTVIVKLLEKYEFSFVDSHHPAETRIHEFNFVSPSVEILMRRRLKEPAEEG